MFKKIINKLLFIIQKIKISISSVGYKLIAKNRNLNILFAPLWPSLHGKIYMLRKRGTDIGKNVFIDYYVWVEGGFPERVHIEDYVIIASGAKIIAHDSCLNNMINFPIKVQDVFIKRNSYIGSGAIIMPGVTIGENSIIGAGSVVTKNIPSNSVAVGNPAKVIMTLEEFIAKNKRLYEQLKGRNFVDKYSPYRPDSFNK